MATKKPTPKRRSPTAKAEPKQTHIRRAIAVMLRPFQLLRHQVRDLLARRPHRSFQRTRRRDYVRSMAMPGYLSFSITVWRMIWRHKRLFVWIIAIYTLFTLLFVGMGSQDTYVQLSDQLHASGAEVFGGDFGAISQAGTLLLTGITGSFSVEPSAVQQVYGAIFVLLLWLTTVWLLRAIMAGRSPRFRDGLYSAGAPIVSTTLVAVTAVVQLLPLAIAVLAFSAAQAAGFLIGGVESMIFWAFAALLTILSLYWLTSTFVALIVVTLPGMYPMQALRTAGDLVIGRRLRVLFRLLWLVLTLIVAWAVVMIPIILLDAWLKGAVAAISWVPLVPVMLVVMGAASVTIGATYVYLLYRRMVDDDATPA